MQEKKTKTELLREYLPECMVMLKSNGDFPLDKLTEVALYGNGVRKTVKGGTGSGEVNSEYFDTIYEAFKKSGINVLTDSWLDKYDQEYLKFKKNFKKHLKKVAKDAHQPIFLVSMGEVMLEGEYDIKTDVLCDTAIYVLSRISGEGADRRLEKGDAYLTDTEVKTINYLSKNYKKFLLVLNVGGVVDLSRVNDVKNILLISQLGVLTSYSLIDVILGKYSPSGKLTTTWTTPSDYQNIGDFGQRDDTCYKEGLYVGYRYFDSLRKNVLYPFGFGLTYSKFEINVNDFKIVDNILNVNVDVLNTGKFKTKEVVQIYVTKSNKKRNNPYQDLVTFYKTDNINPNDKENINIDINLLDLYVYDEESKSYVIDKGEYIFRIGSSSRDNKPFLIVDIEDDIIIRRCKNLFNKPDFDDYSVGIIDNYDYKDIKHLKYNPNIEKETINYELINNIPDDIKKMNDSDLIKLCMGLFDETGGLKSIIGSQAKSVPGAAGETKEFSFLKGLVMADGPQGLRLQKDYFIENGIKYSNSALIPESVKEYMPFYLKWILKLFQKKPKKNTEILHQYTTNIPIGTALAQSYNLNLAYLCGDIVGSEMEKFNVDLWLAPALNIHRNILCGRNFEYYSEDPYVSGIIAANITRGVESHKNKYVTIKHFMANNQEFNRYQSNSVASERVIREIYLKGFEICIKEAHPKAVMTSYNLLNGIHTNENINISKLLRCELKFDGLIMSDWVVKMMANDSKYKAASPVKVIKALQLFMPGSKEDYDEVYNGLNTGLITRDDLEACASILYNFIKNDLT